MDRKRELGECSIGSRYPIWKWILAELAVCVSLGRWLREGGSERGLFLKDS